MVIIQFGRNHIVGENKTFLLSIDSVTQWQISTTNVVTIVEKTHKNMLFLFPREMLVYIGTRTVETCIRDVVVELYPNAVVGLFKEHSRLSIYTWYEFPFLVILFQ